MLVDTLRKEKGNLDDVTSAIAEALKEGGFDLNVPKN
jgi:hypothetical protein